MAATSKALALQPSMSVTKQQLWAAASAQVVGLAVSAHSASVKAPLKHAAQAVSFVQAVYSSAHASYTQATHVGVRFVLSGEQLNGHHGSALLVDRSDMSGTFSVGNSRTLDSAKLYAMESCKV